MYRKHFGLTRHPFGKDLAPEDLFGSAANRELEVRLGHLDRKSTRLNSSHLVISYAVFCLKKKKPEQLSRRFSSHPVALSAYADSVPYERASSREHSPRSFRTPPSPVRKRHTGSTVPLRKR